MKKGNLKQTFTRRKGGVLKKAQGQESLPKPDTENTDQSSKKESK